MKNAPLIIVRGAPGSGKSTFALKIQVELRGLHFETDSFFEDTLDGTYHFDPTFLGTAHAWNQGNVIRACRDYPTVPVIVANTFSHESEIRDYVSIAKRFNREVYVFTLFTKHDNVHGVPDGTVERYRRNIKRVDAAKLDVRAAFNIYTDGMADVFVRNIRGIYPIDTGANP